MALPALRSARRASIALALCLAGSALVASCSVDRAGRSDARGTDAAISRDAAIRDGGGIDAPARDAGEDAAMPPDAGGCLSCDDAIECTRDECVDGRCMRTPDDGACTADDGNPCTTNRCDLVLGCIDEENTRPCDDFDACTDPDRCAGGSCQGGAPIDCGDGNPCTDHSCDRKTGCSTSFNTDSCDDRVYCTDGDQCTGGACVPGPPRDCGAGCTCDFADDRCERGIDMMC
jgi:hypothetical protein